MRFKIHTCHRCLTEIGPGSPAAQHVFSQAYDPMPNGPEWEAVGDWAPEGTGAVLCSDCREDLARWLLGGQAYVSS